MKIFEKIAIFHVQFLGWAYIRAWAIIIIFTVCTEKIKKISPELSQFPLQIGSIVSKFWAVLVGACHIRGIPSTAHLKPLCETAL